MSSDSSMQACIDEYERSLRSETNASAHTLRNYVSDLRQLRAFLMEQKLALNAAADDVAVEAIDGRTIRAFLTYLLRRNRKSSVGRKLSSIKGLFRFLARRTIIERDPT